MKMLRQVTEIMFSLVEALAQITLKATIVSFTNVSDLCLTDISPVIPGLVTRIV
jgi:hypothetical protein